MSLIFHLKWMQFFPQDKFKFILIELYIELLLPEGTINFLEFELRHYNLILSQNQMRYKHRSQILYRLSISSNIGKGRM